MTHDANSGHTTFLLTILSDVAEGQELVCLYKQVEENGVYFSPYPVPHPTLYPTLPYPTRQVLAVLSYKNTFRLLLCFADVDAIVVESVETTVEPSSQVPHSPATTARSHNESGKSPKGKTPTKHKRIPSDEENLGTLAAEKKKKKKKSSKKKRASDSDADSDWQNDLVRNEGGGGGGMDLESDHSAFD